VTVIIRDATCEDIYYCGTAKSANILDTSLLSSTATSCNYKDNYDNDWLLVMRKRVYVCV